MKLTPVLSVKQIEPCLEFWVGRLGYTKTMEVPEGDRIGFAAVEKDGVEIMFQTETLVEEDFKEKQLPFAAGKSMLYIEVEDLDAVIAKLKDVKPAIARRTAPYGMDEIGYIEPGGHLALFAMKLPPKP